MNLCSLLNIHNKIGELMFYLSLTLLLDRNSFQRVETLPKLPEGGWGLKIGRSVSPPAARISAKGASVSSSGMYKNSKLCRGKNRHQVSPS